MYYIVYVWNEILEIYKYKIWYYGYDLNNNRFFCEGVKVVGVSVLCDFFFVIFYFWIIRYIVFYFLYLFIYLDFF